MRPDDLQLDRRALLRLLPASLLTGMASGAYRHCGSVEQSSVEANGKPYTFQFFTESERLLLDRAMEALIPRDEHSPGAHDAKVVEFADLMIATGPDYVKSDWRDGLRLLAAELETQTLDQWMDSATRREDNPETILDEFYKKLKEVTINGYYTSYIGIHEELEYQGNTYLSAFPGCGHPEHKEG